MSEHREHHGGCLCGGVRYVVRGALRDVVVCHCSRCRRTHGHVGAYAACAASDLVLTQDGTLRWYEADQRARGFCGGCGGSLFWRVTGRETVAIAAGTLDPPTGLRTVAQVFTSDRADYYELPPDGRRFPGALPSERARR